MPGDNINPSPPRAMYPRGGVFWLGYKKCPMMSVICSLGACYITEWVKFELSLKKKDILLKQGREKKKEEGKLYGRGNTKDEKVLSIIDRTLYLGVVHLFFMVNIFVRGFLLYGV